MTWNRSTPSSSAPDPPASPAASSCKQRGVKAVLIDKGCVVNSLYHYPTNMVVLHHAGAARNRRHSDDQPEREAGPHRGAEVLPPRGRSLQARHPPVRARRHASPATTAHSRSPPPTASAATHVYHARKIILATGYYDVPNLLNVPGEDLAKVIHYYKEAHPYYNHDVLVIGAKNSAAIAALELCWTGARVTLIHRGAGISDNVKYWIKPNIENRIKNGEITAYFHSRVARDPAETSCRLQTPEGEVTLKNDFVFAMTGYQPGPRVSRMRIGITLDPETQRPRTDPETLESERKGIYLAGVIVAGMHTNEIFIENGRFHGKQIAEAIAARLA